MADPDAIRYLRITQADLVRRGAVGPFERIADLTFYAVQTRYDDSLEIDSGGSCFGLAIANVRPSSASSGQSILGPGAKARAATSLEPVRKHRCDAGPRIKTHAPREAEAPSTGHDGPRRTIELWPSPAPPVVCTGC
jgi:hypothetical protein